MENKMNSQTAFQQSETPVNCATGCGFFGTPSTLNLCSKCYRDHRLKEAQSAAARAAVGKTISPPPSSITEGRETHSLTVEKAASSAAEMVAAVAKKAVSNSNRCRCCNKKVGVVGFKCRCGSTFCGSHRYPEEHNCEFDYKVAAREKLAKANPLVVADKLQRI